jgi:hypothetical protein
MGIACLYNKQGKLNLGDRLEFAQFGTALARPKSHLWKAAWIGIFALVIATFRTNL